MTAVSVVIITKNEAPVLEQTLQAVATFTNDIVIVDSGSTDGTTNIAERMGARVIRTEWLGFGATKNLGVDAARYNWILSIDADEQPDLHLLEAIKHLDLSSTKVVYRLMFKTYLGKKLILHGEWGKDAHVRLFNREFVRWNDAEVHEQLIIPTATITRTLPGFIHHFTVKDVADYMTKMTRYAVLSGDKYFKQGKKASWVKRYLAPEFSFMRNYIFKLGFLDGWEGYLIARVTAHYTLAKYARLHELNRNPNK